MKGVNFTKFRIDLSNHCSVLACIQSIIEYKEEINNEITAWQVVKWAGHSSADF